MPYDREGELPPVQIQINPQTGQKHLDFSRYIPFGLTAIANKIARSASRIYLLEFGVGINEWRIVANLRVNPGTTANAICQASALDKAAVSRSLKLLEETGHVLAAEDDGDVRRRTLHLTPKGDELHDRLIVLALKREARLLTGFSEAERAQLIDFIARMHANVALVAEETGGEG
jgi:DNA-binding MarR family transcriptional regulator